MTGSARGEGVARRLARVGGAAFVMRVAARLGGDLELRIPEGVSALEAAEALVGICRREGLLEELEAASSAMRQEDLTTHILDLDSVCDRVRVEDFTGREWLLARIDAFIEQQASGYVIVEAAGGLGKSSLAAHLMVDRNVPGVFVELAPGAAGGSHVYRSLAASVVVAWGCKDEALERQVRLGQVVDAVDLMRVVQAADVDGPRVLVIDGLDLADDGGEPGNALALPRRLPAGVFIVATRRPGRSLDVDSRLVLDLAATEPANLDDLRRYLDRALGREPLAGVAVQAQGGPAALRDALVDRSEGVWIYVHFALADLASGRLQVQGLAFPQGLPAYYRSMVLGLKRRAGPAWFADRLDLLGALGALREPVSVEAVCDVAGVPCTAEVRSLFTGAWRALVGSNAHGRVMVYHQSLRDYLRGIGGLIESTSERAFRGELAAAVSRGHVRAADVLLRSLEGQPEGWGTGAPDGLSSGYLRRHLVGHLLDCRRFADLAVVLEARTDDARPAWMAMHVRARDIATWHRSMRLVVRSVVRRYRDVDPVMALAQMMKGGTVVLAPDEIEGLPVAATAIAQLVRARRSTRQEPGAVAGRFASGELTLDDAETLLADIDHGPSRIEGLIALAGVAPPGESVRLLEDALRVARLDVDAHEALIRQAPVVPHLDPQRTDEVLRAVMDAAPTFLPLHAAHLLRTYWDVLGPDERQLAADRLGQDLEEEVSSFVHSHRSFGVVWPDLGPMLGEMSADVREGVLRALVSWAGHTYRWNPLLIQRTRSLLPHLTEAEQARIDHQCGEWLLEGAGDLPPSSPDDDSGRLRQDYTDKVELRAAARAPGMSVERLTAVGEILLPDATPSEDAEWVDRADALALARIGRRIRRPEWVEQGLSVLDSDLLGEADVELWLVRRPRGATAEDVHLFRRSLEGFALSPVGVVARLVHRLDYEDDDHAVEAALQEVVATADDPLDRCAAIWLTRAVYLDRELLILAKGASTPWEAAFLTSLAGRVGQRPPAFRSHAHALLWSAAEVVGTEGPPPRATLERAFGTAMANPEFWLTPTVIAAIAERAPPALRVGLWRKAWTLAFRCADRVPEALCWIGFRVSTSLAMEVHQRAALAGLLDALAEGDSQALFHTMIELTPFLEEAFGGHVASELTAAMLAEGLWTHPAVVQRGPS